MKFLIDIWPYVLNHANLFLFIGMLFGGETFLLLAIYLAVKGTLDFPHVIFLAALASLISDTIWYAIGHVLSLEKILSWKIFLKKRELFSKIFAIFNKHTQKLLYISKFVYGTRTMAQILSGTVHMPFIRYSIINLAGIMSYLITIVFVAFLTKESLVSFTKMLYYEYIFIAVFIFFIVIIHICLKKWLGKEFTVSLSQPTMKS